MIDEEMILSIIILLVIMIGALTIITALTEGDYEYKNLTGIVTNKTTETITTYCLVSNGETTVPVPMTHTNYWFNTTDGEVVVSPEDYNKYDVNDTINITKNMNTTELRIR